MLLNQPQSKLELLNQSDLQSRSEPALELHSRAVSSVGVRYRSSGPNTGSNSGGGQIQKNKIIITQIKKFKQPYQHENK